MDFMFSHGIDMRADQPFIEVMTIFSKSKAGLLTGLAADIGEDELLDFDGPMPQLHFFMYDSDELLPRAAWHEFVHIVRRRYRLQRRKEPGTDSSKLATMVGRVSWTDITRRDCFGFACDPTGYAGHVYPVFGFLGNGYVVHGITQAVCSETALRDQIYFYNQKLVSDLFRSLVQLASVLADQHRLLEGAMDVPPPDGFVEASVNDLLNYINQPGRPGPLFRLDESRRTPPVSPVASVKNLDKELDQLSSEFGLLFDRHRFSAIIAQQLAVWFSPSLASSSLSALAGPAMTELQVATSKPIPVPTALQKMETQQKDKLLAKTAWHLCMAKAGELDEELADVFEQYVEKAFLQAMRAKVEAVFSSFRKLKAWSTIAESAEKTKRLRISENQDQIKTLRSTIETVSRDLVAVLSMPVGCKGGSSEFTRVTDAGMLMAVLPTLLELPSVPPGPVFGSDVSRIGTALRQGTRAPTTPLCQLSTCFDTEIRLPDFGLCSEVLHFVVDSYVLNLREAFLR